MTDWDIDGKRVIITGATNGIGLAGAEELARLGAEVAIVARSEERAADAVRRIEAAIIGAGSVDVLLADLASQASVRRLAAEALARYPRIDVLINNAGAVYTTHQVTEDGIELTWAVNHLAPFLLTSLLLERLEASAPARIVTTTSDAHRGATIPFGDFAAEKRYRGYRRYGETKLANILFTVELARRLEGMGVTANCYHPGFVATGWNRNNGALLRSVMTLGGWLVGRSPAKGADTMVWLAASPDVAAETGGYFYDRRRRRPTAIAQDMDVAAALWEASEEQIRRRARP